MKRKKKNGNILNKIFKLIPTVVNKILLKFKDF